MCYLAWLATILFKIFSYTFIKDRVVCFSWGICICLWYQGNAGFTECVRKFPLPLLFLGRVWIELVLIILYIGGFPSSSLVKNPPAMQETCVWSLGQEDPMEEGMATPSSILAWILKELHTSCKWILHESTNRGSWQATVHRVAESDTTEETTHTDRHSLHG